MDGRWWNRIPHVSWSPKFSYITTKLSWTAVNSSWDVRKNAWLYKSKDTPLLRQQVIAVQLHSLWKHYDVTHCHGDEKYTSAFLPNCHSLSWAVHSWYWVVSSLPSVFEDGQPQFLLLRWCCQGCGARFCPPKLSEWLSTHFYDSPFNTFIMRRFIKNINEEEQINIVKVASGNLKVIGWWRILRMTLLTRNPHRERDKGVQEWQRKRDIQTLNWTGSLTWSWDHDASCSQTRSLLSQEGHCIPIPMLLHKEDYFGHCEDSDP